MPARWLVDGMNVIGSRPTGWWRDREGAMRELAEELASFAERSGDEVTVVFDGREPEEPIETAAVNVLFAPGGPNSADDAIVDLLEADPDPGGVCVVTSDAALAERAKVLGAGVVGAGSFRSRLDR
jgi:predicted RNA-binding protein with PIN domain